MYATVQELGENPVVEDALPPGKSREELNAAIETMVLGFEPNARSADHEANEGGDLKILLVKFIYLRAQNATALQEPEVKLFGASPGASP